VYAKQKHQVRQTKHQVRQTKHKVRQPKYQVRQTKHQMRNLIQKSTPKKQILIYAVLSRCNFCREFTNFFGVPFTGLKIWWRTKNDKYEVWAGEQSEVIAKVILDMFVNVAKLCLLGVVVILT